jgi:hypothetical protein
LDQLIPMPIGGLKVLRAEKQPFIPMNR